MSDEGKRPPAHDAEALDDYVDRLEAEHQEALENMEIANRAAGERRIAAEARVRELTSAIEEHRRERARNAGHNTARDERLYAALNPPAEEYPEDEWDHDAPLVHPPRKVVARFRGRIEPVDPPAEDGRT